MVGFGGGVEGQGSHLVVQVLDLGLVSVLGEGVGGVVLGGVAAEGVGRLLVRLEGVLAIRVLGLVGSEVEIILVRGLGVLVGLLVVVLGLFRSASELGQVGFGVHVATLTLLLLGEVVERIVFDGSLGFNGLLVTGVFNRLTETSIPVGLRSSKSVVGSGRGLLGNMDGSGVESLSLVLETLG